LERLLTPLKSLTLPPVDRLGVQGDAFALAKAGLLPTSQALDIALALRNEVDYTVWSSLSTNLGALASVWQNEPDSHHFSAFTRHLYEPIAKKLGWEAKPGESALDTLLRGLVLGRLGTNGHQPTIEEARKRFKEFLSNPDSLPVDLRGAVYEIVLSNGGQEEQNHLINLYRTTGSVDEKNRILRLLVVSSNAAVTTKALEFSLAGEVRDQDLFLFFPKLGSVQHGPKIGWEFLQNNWDTYNKRLAHGGHLLPRIIEFATNSFNSVDKAKEIEVFFEAHPLPSAHRTVRQAIEGINTKVAWLNRSRADISKWFALRNFI